MRTSWSNLAYVQGFYYESITKKYVKFFELMEIALCIYKDLVEHSYKKTTREDANHVYHSRKMRGEAASENTYSKTSDSADKRRKRYVDHLKNISKLTCIIHGPRHSSDECKVLGDFGYKNAKRSPTKDNKNYSTNRKNFNRHQYKNYIVNHGVYERLPKENNKVSAEEESQTKIESELNGKNLDQIDSMSLDDNKEKTE